MQYIQYIVHMRPVPSSHIEKNEYFHANFNRHIDIIVIIIFIIIIGRLYTIGIKIIFKRRPANKDEYIGTRDQ